MATLDGQSVIDADGIAGRILALEPPDGDGTIQALIEIAGARCVLVPEDAIQRDADGRLRLPFSFAAIVRGASALPAGDAGEHRIPVIEERPVIQKRTVVTGKVRVTKRVQEREEVIDEPLLREQVEVTRVPVGAWVEAPVPVRQDGDTTVVPLLEEVLVVEKRLRLVEEVHIRKRRSEFHDPKTVTLRREEAVVEPSAADDGEPRAGGKDE